MPGTGGSCSAGSWSRWRSAGFGFVMRAVLNLVHPPLGAAIGDWPAAALLTLAAVPLSIAAGWYAFVFYVEMMFPN